MLGLIREGEGVGAQVLATLGAELHRVRQAVIQLLSGYSEADLAHEQRGVGRSVESEPVGIRPARCGFCNMTSPECGPLYTGTSGALICITCAQAAAGGSPAERAQHVALMRARAWGPIREFVPERTEYPEPLDVLAARHEPAGPPPVDEETARQAIEYAFTDPMEVSADDTELVNVEDGLALKPYGDQVMDRVGWMIRTRRT